MTGTLAPWCVNEKWTFWIGPNGKQYAKVTGRELAPASLKRNPLWWFRNDYEQQVPEDYHPDWPMWRRELWWAGIRNPLQNGRLYVLGWADRNYTVEVLEGNPDPMVVQRDDVGEMGVQRTKLTAENGDVRTWYSYCSKHLVWYNGTQPTGVYGTKFNVR